MAREEYSRSYPQYLYQESVVMVYMSNDMLIFGDISKAATEDIHQNKIIKYLWGKIQIGMIESLIL